MFLVGLAMSRAGVKSHRVATKGILVLLIGGVLLH